jgi:hypothetical protein
MRGRGSGQTNEGGGLATTRPKMKAYVVKKQNHGGFWKNSISNRREICKGVKLVNIQ